MTTSVSAWRDIINAHDWLVKIGAMVLLGLIVNLFEWLLYRRLLPRFLKKHNVWRRSFLEAFHAPFQVYITAIVATLSLSVIASHLEFTDGFISSIGMFQRLMTLLFALWFGIRFIRRVENGITHRTKEGVGKISDETSIHAMSQVARITLIAITLLMMLQMMGVKMSALLAFGGVGGAVIAFAAKDSLANFIGGMMIYWDRPFSVGDWIRSPDREIEGTVENIGWRLTRIRTFDQRPLFVPNGILANIALENPSRMMNRRIKLTLGVRYSDASKIAGLTKDIEKMLNEHPEIDPQCTTFVNLYEFGASSLNILIYTFTKITAWVKFQTVQQDVLLKVLDIVAEHGAECAFPTRTLDLPEDVFSSIRKKGEHYGPQRGNS